MSVDDAEHSRGSLAPDQVSTKGCGHLVACCVFEYLVKHVYYRILANPFVASEFVMVDDLRYKRLTSAKSFALAGNYRAAYDILDALCQKYPYDAEMHRLHGNVLELDAYASKVTNPMDRRLRSARKHYTVILRKNRWDRQAIFDMAEHFASIKKLRVAQCFYEKFLSQYGNEKSEEVERAREWLAGI